jgi:hypothetical protein
MNGWPALDRCLRTDPRDVGCAEAMDLLHVYAELAAADASAAERYPGIAAHLQACGPCGEDFEKRVEAGVAEFPVTDAGPDLRAQKSQLTHAAPQLRDGQAGVLQGHRAESAEPVRPLRDQSGRKSFCARASTAAPSAGASWQNVTGTGETTCSATPSASMSASRLPADRQRLSMSRYWWPPTRMRARVSLLCCTEGQCAQGATAARSGSDGAMAWVCRSMSPLRAGPDTVAATDGIAVCDLGTAATTRAPPCSPGSAATPITIAAQERQDRCSLRAPCCVSGFHAEIPAHGLGAIGGSELAEKVLDVRLDRAFRNDQPRGDAGVGLAGCHKPQDVDLASSQL